MSYARSLSRSVSLPRVIRPWSQHRLGSTRACFTQRSPISSPSIHSSATRAFSTRSCLHKEALTSTSPAPEPSEREQQPAYEMTFTCKQCNTRSTHRISKQGYHHGTVLVQCPGCKNRHLIADHLKIFSDTRITLEDILKEKGQLLKTGTISGEGDVEFWDDGTQTPRASSQTEK